MPTQQQSIAAEKSLHDQTQLLPKRQLLTTFLIISIALLVCFIDQNCINVLQPTIARDLDAEATIGWTGTALLIAMCAFSPLYGRLSDLFGRKIVLISALLVLAISDLACGLSRNATMLFVFRGFAGLAGGGINNVVNMIVSDVVSLQDRGKYQGILGLQVGLGNALGPLIATGFAKDGSWRGIFYLLAPLSVFVAGACWKWLPSNMPKVNFKETVAKIDFLGLFTGTVAVILLLIPTAEGGHAGSAWKSPKVIAMYSIGGTLLVAFVLVEWKWAKLPMMPMSMFGNRSIATMLVQSFLLGTIYYTYGYCLTQYLQNVHGETPLIAACLLMPMSIVQSAISAGAGYYQSLFNRYAEIFWFGFAVWGVGGGILLLCDEDTPLEVFCPVVTIIGLGMGCCFQPMLVALQAHCPKSQRAVVTSFRNFLRSAGGSAGLAISSAILSHVLKKSLPPHLVSVMENTFAKPDSSEYLLEDEPAIIAAYAAASRMVFICCLPVIGVCFLLCGLIKDNGLMREEEKKASDEGLANDSVMDMNDVERAVPTEAYPSRGAIGFDERLRRFDWTVRIVCSSGGRPSFSSDSSAKSSDSTAV